MAIIDCIIWQPQGREVIYAYRYPEQNLSTYTQLVVQESQEAVLFSKGQIMGKFGPGKHTLNTENLPILRNLFGIPFGGKNPFTAEVWFVNKVQTFAIDWSIDRMAIHDIDYNTQLPLVASGQYGLKVIDTEKFLVKFVGTKYKFTQEDMTEQSYGEFCSKAKSLILQFMLNNKIGYKQISAFLDPISENLRNMMQDFWYQLGLELTKFYVTSIEIDDSTPEGQKVREAIAQQASMSITGHTWQQEQMFGTANNAINGVTNGIGNMGSGGTGSLLGGLMAVQMMGTMGRMATAGGNGGIGSGMMQPNYNQPTFNAGGNANAGNTVNNVRDVYCAGCSKKFSTNQAFCPHCGKKYNPCPKCGADNAESSKRCVSCGTSLSVGGAGNICPQCHQPVAPGARFCGNCGTPMGGTNENVCSRCGAELAPNVKFCPVCGNRR
ncbi:MAG: SPFH domain-containing protein [Bacteroidales bacterium]|nr:SPFH domain-containing protein [Bacteroidales bacterium]